MRIVSVPTHVAPASLGAGRQEKLQRGVAGKGVVNASATPSVTVIVPMLNERTHIAECLGSLLEQDYPPCLVQILVVDGMSDDGSRDVVRASIREHADRKISLLDNPRRIPAAALNLGIREADGDVIIRLDAHSFAASDYISKSVAYLSKTDAACVGGPIKSVAGCPVGQAIALAMASPVGVGNALFRYAHEEQYVDTVAFGAYHKAVFEHIGLFDEELIYSEDNEFNHRLRKHGGKILLTPEIRPYYHPRESLTELWRQYYHYGFGRVKHMIRSPDSIMLRHMIPFGFVSALLIFGLLSLVSLPFRWLLLFQLLGYLLALFLFSLGIAVKRGWGYLPVLPAAFACLHLSYGLGMYSGLLNLLMIPKRE